MVADLDVQVGRAVATSGKDKVGVYLISLEEAAPIMEAAAKTQNLTEVRWYGCDGNVLLDALATSGDRPLCGADELYRPGVLAAGSRSIA
jgi:branched-chain amino acid transport system substrate-binding protein